jgi:undecaprenyl-diphosphatase
VDTTLFLAINGPGHPWLDLVMWTVSEVGRGDMAVLLCFAVVMAAQGRARVLPAVALVAATLLAGVVTERVKHAVQRPRPLAAMGERVHVVGEELRARSFPSGHTASAFALCVATGRLVRRRWAWVGGALLACAVGFSRVWVGAHYPLDVLGGAAVGLVTGEVAFRLVNWVAIRLAARKPQRSAAPPAG